MGYVDDKLNLYNLDQDSEAQNVVSYLIFRHSESFYIVIFKTIVST